MDDSPQKSFDLLAPRGSAVQSSALLGRAKQSKVAGAGAIWRPLISPMILPEHGRAGHSRALLGSAPLSSAKQGNGPRSDPGAVDFTARLSVVQRS